MPHHYIHNISHATPLLEAIQRYLLGSFCALLGRCSNASNAFGSLRALFGFGRNCNSDVGNASASDRCTSRERALTSSSESDNSSPAASIVFAFALACSTKGANSLSNSESEDSFRVDLSELELLKISLFQSRNLSALLFRASCATQRLLL
jgi:hypothetical protein